MMDLLSSKLCQKGAKIKMRFSVILINMAVFINTIVFNSKNVALFLIYLALF